MDERKQIEQPRYPRAPLPRAPLPPSFRRLLRPPADSPEFPQHSSTRTNHFCSITLHTKTPTTQAASQGALTQSESSNPLIKIAREWTWFLTCVNNEDAETSPPVGSTKADDGWQQAGPHLWAAMHIRAMIHLFFTTLLQTMNEGTAIGMLDMSRDDFWGNAEQQERESRLAKPLVAGRTGDDQGGLAHPDGTQHNIILWGHEFGKVGSDRPAGHR
jgi:hypothetical protein